MPLMPKRRRNRKSAKRVQLGKKLARTLPRDAKGKFLPRGSKNLFRKKRKARKKRRRKSAPARRRRRKQPVKRAKLTRRRSQPAMSRRRQKTKDDFPNFLSGDIIQPSPNTFATATINTPIPRLKTIGNKATVMELLYCDIKFTNITLNSVNANVFFQMTLGSTQNQLLRWSDTRVFLDWRVGVNEAPFGGTNVNHFIHQGVPFRYQFQTLDGFGYLLAADSFKIAVDSTNQSSNTAIIDFKLYYRFVDIPLSEFIGIVQSTQAQ